MAINIFQGGSKPKSGVNSAKASTRAANAQAALRTVGETSSSGATAVARKGTLSKVGNFVGKAAGIAAKFLPGMGGTVAKGLANLFNDPEWWQSVPGDAITLNSPLRSVLLKQAASIEPGQANWYAARHTFAEFDSIGTNQIDAETVMHPSDAMVTQYLMSEIRKVVNAIPLQSADIYAQTIAVNATAYALWRNLLKYDYLLKHGQTYLPSFNDSAFPILQVQNAATLQSYINRLEEYLRASVRLPHTMCEYLAWRFGRIYKSNDSAKSGLIMYNVISITASMSNYASLIDRLTTANSAAMEVQQANADLYNTYYDHDQAVVIRDDTQFVFDKKEFMLRTNLDISTAYSDETQNLINIDSSLDNPTSFMASTVSTKAGTDGALFPVPLAYAFMPKDGTIQGFNAYVAGVHPTVINAIGTSWIAINLQINGTSGSAAYLADAAVAAMACKSLDIYNKNIWLVATATTDVNSFQYLYDLTAISIDAGQVTDLVLANEHVYAFANLVHMDRKRSETYAQAEKQVARDTANLVETLDVATKA